MRVLGVSFGHGAAAALVEDGEVLSAIEEEKLTRIKGHNTFPKMAVAFVHERNRVTPEDIDYVAVGCEHLVEFAYGYRTLNRFLGRDAFGDKLKGVFFDGTKRVWPSAVDLSKPLTSLFFSYLAELGFPRDRVKLVQHHEAHAASVYYTSPPKDAAILTMDGKGDGLSASYSIGEGGTIRCIDQIEDIHSIGQFYQSVTAYLGYRVNRHEEKITGLAAYGDYSETYPLMNDIYQHLDGNLRNTFHDIPAFTKDPIAYFKKHVDRGGFVHVNYLKALQGRLIAFAVGHQLFINYLTDEMGHFSPEDIAAGIQKLAEESIVSYARKMLETNFKSDMCLAGGVFANVKVNQRIREIEGVKNVFVHPAMDDAGVALGAALMVSMDGAKEEKKWDALGTVYLGPEYSAEDIENALRESKLPYKEVHNFEEELGRLIHEGKIIGRFDGALEWGPRALGNRSILASPTDKTINDTLNERLKRTEFMPFAPAVLEEDAERYFLSYRDDHVAARYMTITYDVEPSLIEQIQATVHVDGTARPQIVRQADNPSFYEIISAYKERSGIGAIINTSFNMHEEPIVNTPQDAIRAYTAGAVDVLSMGSFIVESEYRPAR